LIAPPPVAVAAAGETADVTADEAGAAVDAVGTGDEIAIAPGLREVAAGKETDTL